MKHRTEEKVSATQGTFDVCVIGGGASGAGCALDAQLRGLKTILLDAGDFASAASSASTKLVHGGVRYLEQAIKSFNLEEYRMVKNALRERLYMLANAPHLAHQAQFLVPVYSWARAVYYLVGMKLYDAVAAESNLFPSRFLSREETLKTMPGLKARGLRGAVSYSDGQFDDARYDLALIETFVAAGGTALNYARVTGFARGDRGMLTSAAVRDELSGETFLVSVKKFVNATGTGADKIRRLANPMLAARMRPSKGVHLLFSAETFAGTDALLVPHTEDGRVIFAVPWQGRLLVGTTEEEVTPATRMLVTKDEAEYLLRQLNPYLETPLRRQQTVSGMAGLRPLVAAGHGQTATSRLIRDHEVELDSSSGMISILGGKWTTHRLMAEDTIDAVQREMGGPVTPSTTKQHSLAGAAGYDKGFSKDIEKEYSLPADVAKHLAGKFGTTALKILQLLKENPSWNRRIAGDLPVIEAEIISCIRYDVAVTNGDLLARRSGAQLHGWQEAIEAAPRVAELLAQEKHCEPSRRVTAVSEYTTKIAASLNELGLNEAKK
jgi:glycerol-3-phosphate dehydrogenase